MGRPCVSGSSEIDINYDKKIFKTKSLELKEGDLITIDGSTGRIIQGEVPKIKPEISGDFSKLMSWADSFRKLKVRTNSETSLDTKTARDFGAEGIGLCRTEHMARGVISVAQRAEYIARIRDLAKGVGQIWLESQK